MDIPLLKIHASVCSTCRLKWIIFLFFQILFQKMISIDESMVVQSFSINLQTLGITKEILTIHGKYDKIQVQLSNVLSLYYKTN